MRSQRNVKKIVFLVPRGTVTNTRDLRELGLKIRQTRSDSKRIIFIKKKKYIEKNDTIWENYLVDIFFLILGISPKISLVKSTSKQPLPILSRRDAGEVEYY